MSLTHYAHNCLIPHISVENFWLFCLSTACSSTLILLLLQHWFSLIVCLQNQYCFQKYPCTWVFPTRYSKWVPLPAAGRLRPSQPVLPWYNCNATELGGLVGKRNGSRLRLKCHSFSSFSSRLSRFSWFLFCCMPFVYLQGSKIIILIVLSSLIAFEREFAKPLPNHSWNQTGLFIFLVGLYIFYWIVEFFWSM